MADKIHEIVNETLFRNGESYPGPEQEQKDKAALWFTEELQRFFRENGEFPSADEIDTVIERLYNRMESAEIRIPYEEVYNRFSGDYPEIRESLIRSKTAESGIPIPEIHILPLSEKMSVCKVEDYNGVDLTQEFTFTGKTDSENSLVCPTRSVPGNTVEREDGWRMFRITGVLDFGLIGILAGISTALAENGIGIFAISTFNTDYILVKERHFREALDVLERKGYVIQKIKGETAWEDLF